MKHGMADIEPGLCLDHVTAGAGPRTIVLLHGFPQTRWQWHRVIPAFVDAGFRVVARDSRGAGHSWCPAGGYDKVTMAGTSSGCCASTCGSRARSCSPATTSG